MHLHINTYEENTHLQIMLVFKTREPQRSIVSSEVCWNKQQIVGWSNEDNCCLLRIILWRLSMMLVVVLISFPKMWNSKIHTLTCTYISLNPSPPQSPTQRKPIINSTTDSTAVIHVCFHQIDVKQYYPLYWKEWSSPADKYKGRKALGLV